MLIAQNDDNIHIKLHYAARNYKVILEKFWQAQ